MPRHPLRCIIIKRKRSAGTHGGVPLRPEKQACKARGLAPETARHSWKNDNFARSPCPTTYHANKLTDLNRSRPFRVGVCLLSGENERRHRRRMVPLGSRVPALSGTQHAPAGQSRTNTAHRHRLSRMDGHWRRWYRRARHRISARTRHIRPSVLRHHAHSLRHWPENDLRLRTTQTASVMIKYQRGKQLIRVCSADILKYPTFLKVSNIRPR